METEELTKRQKLKIKAKATARAFNDKIRESINTAVVAAFGFLIALAWRDVITEYMNRITALSPVQGKIISAVTITIVSVLGILIITTLLRKKE